MSPAAKRGLQIAKDLLRREMLNSPYSRRLSEMQQALDWIAHQEAIDDKRRRRRA